MQENDLKKLNRKQLLDLLLKQTERAEQLELQLQEADEKLTALTAQKTEREYFLMLKLREASDKLEILSRQNSQLTSQLDMQIRETKEKLALLATQKNEEKKAPMAMQIPAEPDTRMDGVLEAALIQYLKNLDEASRKKPQEKQENINHAEKG